jgi:hypothetical protein
MNYAALRYKYSEFRAGWRVVGILLRSLTHGEPRVTWPSPSGAFYPLGWWWEGEHILLPQMLEEERIAAQLEEVFGDTDGVTIRPSGGFIGLGTTTPSTLFSVAGPMSVSSAPTPGSITYSSGTGSMHPTPLVAQDSYSNALVVTPPGGPPVGYWKWESVKIGTTTAPSPIRQWLLKTLIGATYSPTTLKTESAPTKSSSPTPLSVLEGYLG